MIDRATPQGRYHNRERSSFINLFTGRGIQQKVYILLQGSNVFTMANFIDKLTSVKGTAISIVAAAVISGAAMATYTFDFYDKPKEEAVEESQLKAIVYCQRESNVSADFNNDGTLDIVVGKINCLNERTDIFYWPSGKGSYGIENKIGEAPMPVGNLPYVAPWNEDNDGWLDILVDTEDREKDVINKVFFRNLQGITFKEVHRRKLE